MVKKIAWGIVAALALWFWLVWFMPRPVIVEPAAPGSTTITVRSGNARAVFTLGTTETMTLLLVGGDTDSFCRVFKGSLLALPLKTAEKLRRQYPDFRKCDSPGAAAGREAMVHFRLVPGTPAVLKDLGAIVKAEYAGAGDVWVELTGRTLSLVDLTQSGIEVNMNDDTIPMLVTSLRRIPAPPGFAP